MSVYRRRAVIVAAAVLIVLAAFLAAAVADRLGAPIDPYQVAWATLSVEIVAAVYKWGVGGWSRYAPPEHSPRSGAELPAAAALPGAAPPSSSPPVRADPQS